MTEECRPPKSGIDKSSIIAIIGSGLIGSSWAALFAAAGHEVRLYDHDAEALERARAHVDTATWDLVSIGVSEPPAGKVIFELSLKDAVADADLVQECVVEAVEVKKEVFAAVRAANSEAIVASSTSTFPPTELFADLRGRERALVVHPLLPPHLVPVSELVPAPFTAAATMDTAAALIASTGHEVIRLTRELQGFVLNRLQFALMGEAMHLVDSGICEPGDIDKALTAGLGLRWACVGPFTQTHLNADGGARGSLLGYRAAIDRVLKDLRPDHPWSEALIDRIDAAMSRTVPVRDIPAARLVRDAQLIELRSRLIRHRGEVPPSRARSPSEWNG